MNTLTKNYKYKQRLLKAIETSENLKGKEYVLEGLFCTKESTPKIHHKVVFGGGVCNIYTHDLKIPQEVQLKSLSINTLERLISLILKKED